MEFGLITLKVSADEKHKNICSHPTDPKSRLIVLLVCYPQTRTNKILLESVPLY